MSKCLKYFLLHYFTKKDALIMYFSCIAVLCQTSSSDIQSLHTRDHPTETPAAQIHINRLQHSSYTMCQTTANKGQQHNNHPSGTNYFSTVYMAHNIENHQCARDLSTSNTRCPTPSNNTHNNQHNVEL